jgi:hypothetical protein
MTRGPSTRCQAVVSVHLRSRGRSKVHVAKPLAQWAVALLLAAISSTAIATKALDLDAVRSQQSEIYDGVTTGSGRFEHMPIATRTRLLEKQATLMALLEGKQSADELSEPQRLEVFNVLEWIEATINQTPDERMICRRERTIGSTRLTRVCRTAAEEERMKEEARRRLQEGGTALGDR